MVEPTQGRSPAQSPRPARSALLWALRALMAALLLALLAVFGRFPQGSDAERGLLRLAWRMVGERVRVCRDYTAAELQKVPPHMRQGQGQVCEQHLLPYRLRAWVDDVNTVDEAVRPAGIRGDRPLYVQEDFPLSPGRYRVRVHFDPGAGTVQTDGQAAGAPAAAGEAGGGSGGVAQATREATSRAVRYRFEGEIAIRAGRIVMIDLDEHAREFRVFGNAGAAH
ncbi:MAG: hypothetical protein HY423_02400 [Candidatus Lambdaproteobacteria bacterium]|nr:hypothetical protein [Candidatus Lambdaproteobacteria bacterium]